MPNLPELHGARGLTAHELLERRLARQEAQARFAEAMHRFVDSAVEVIRAWSRSIEEAFQKVGGQRWVREVLDRIKQAYRDSLPSSAQVERPGGFRRCDYWRHQRIRLERLLQRGQLLPRQNTRLRLARANS